jgi:tRNA pseudouridine38-40 synthase
MLKNFLLIVEYDGTDFHGWQRQIDQRTIQGEIEKVLKRMTRQDISLTGSGRTDAGVHALAQVANFFCRTCITPEAFYNGLNSLLPPGIIIKACREVDSAFHARFNVKSKTYRYHIINRNPPLAIGRSYAWHIRQPLDVTAMQQAARHLSGQHDFKTFEAVGSPRSHTVRKVSHVSLQWENPELLAFEITADGFLRYMVRKIIGTLVDVGRGRRSPDEFRLILKSRDRSRSGATAPARGLFLKRVYYQETEGNRPA